MNDKTQNAMQAQLPSWRIPGMITDVREMKTKLDKVWAYSLKIMAYGGTYEAITKDESIFKSISSGQQVVLHGDFDQFKGELKLHLTRVEEVATGTLGKIA